MSVRHELARDIWQAGVHDPDLLAEHLIRAGWHKAPCPRPDPALAAVTLEVLTPTTGSDLRAHRQRQRDTLTRPERTEALRADLAADLDYYRSD